MTEALQFQTDPLMDRKNRVVCTGTGLLLTRISRFVDLVGK